MKHDSRKLEFEKNLKYNITFVIRSRDTRDIKELRPPVEVI